MAGVGAYVYVNLRDDLMASVDSGLQSRAQVIRANVAQSDPALGGGGHRRLIDPDEAFAQVLTPAGRIVESTRAVARAPLVSPADLATVTGPRFLDHRPIRLEKSRLLIVPVEDRGKREFVVVGATLSDAQEALDTALVRFAVALPVALLISSLIGWLLSGAALRPVERMRRRAAELTGEAEGRLPVPPSHDEIQRLGDTLNAMLGRLQAVLARERSFVSDASHELRTPLAILRTELELALRGERSRDELEDAVRSAAEETERLNQLADDLLVIARSDQGRLPVRPAEIDAETLLEGVAHRFAARARDERRTLRAEPADGLTLTADRARLEQALANMVDNALRHGEGDVVLSAAQENGQVELHVRDRGPGFPSEFLPSAFERFSRADEARSRGGTGLGLAITSAVAKAHGGEAHASNREEGGADVWLVLPHRLSSSTHREWGT